MLDVNGARRVLEPKGRVDRGLYALVTLTWPITVLNPGWNENDLVFPLGILTLWWAICAFYTLDGLLERWGRWRRAP